MSLHVTMVLLLHMLPGEKSKMEKSIYRMLHTNISIFIHITAYIIKQRIDKAKEGQKHNTELMSSILP